MIMLISKWVQHEHRGQTIGGVCHAPNLESKRLYGIYKIVLLSKSKTPSPFAYLLNLVMFCACVFFFSARLEMVVLQKHHMQTISHIFKRAILYVSQFGVDSPFGVKIWREAVGKMYCLLRCCLGYGLDVYAQKLLTLSFGQNDSASHS